MSLRNSSKPAAAGRETVLPQVRPYRNIYFLGFAGETVSARAGLPIGAAADEQIARVLVAPLSFTVLGIR
jgi:hypothetical protein